jgi:hypothetical protein
MPNLDLTDDEHASLVRLVKHALDIDRFPIRGDCIRSGRHLAKLEHVDDVLVDPMRGRSHIRINLRNVPEGERPPEDPPEPDYDPWPAAAHG